jgi:hypothetical protein
MNEQNTTIIADLQTTWTAPSDFEPHLTCCLGYDTRYKESQLSQPG